MALKSNPFKTFALFLMEFFLAFYEPCYLIALIVKSVTSGLETN